TGLLTDHTCASIRFHWATTLVPRSSNVLGLTASGSMPVFRTHGCFTPTNSRVMIRTPRRGLCIGRRIFSSSSIQSSEPLPSLSISNFKHASYETKKYSCLNDDLRPAAGVRRFPGGEAEG